MEWISVENYLPPENTAVLVWYKNQQLPYDTHVGVRKFRGFDIHITHWMPLPNPPNHLEDERL